ncbi:MAG: hypothetical protein DELT_01787 [Desulfovibrio sp.]
MEFAFPARFAERYLPDDAFAEAYDTLAPEERAQIKTAITRNIAVQTACACPETGASVSRKTMRQGFVIHEETRAADWAAVFWDASYTGWTRILAALLPAVLAGVPNILACQIDSGQADSGRAVVPPAVLAAMELAGQETVAVMASEEALAFLEECAAQNAAGRVVLLGEDTALDDMAAAAARLGVSSRRYAKPLRIAAEVGLNASVLQFAHPDVAFLPHDEMYAPFSAVFCEEEFLESHAGRAPLVLTPGQEAFWVWDDLAVAFYQERTRALAARPLRM